MKKSVIILSAALMLFSIFAFATDSDKVNARVRNAFLNDFTTASNVSWELSRDFYFATFILNNIEISAAYNEQGELVGTSRTIERSQLPIILSMALDKKYEGYTISKKALEMAFEGSTRYYITVYNDRQTLKLKCSPDGIIEVDRKIKRK